MCGGVGGFIVVCHSEADGVGISEGVGVGGALVVASVPISKVPAPCFYGSVTVGAGVGEGDSGVGVCCGGIFGEASNRCLVGR